MEINKLFLLCLFIIIPFVSGAGLYGRDVPITHSVRLDGAPLSVTPLCNITVFYNNSIEVPFKQMTFNNVTQTVNYTIPSNNITNVGKHTYDITCCASGLCTTQTNVITINKSGIDFTNISTAFYIVLFLLSIGMFIFFLFMVNSVEATNTYNDYGGLVAIDYNKYKKQGYIVLALVCFVWIMFEAWFISFNYLDIDTMSSIFFLGWSIPMRFAGVIIGAIILLFLYQAWNDFWTSKEIQRFGEA